MRYPPEPTPWRRSDSMSELAAPPVDQQGEEQAPVPVRRLLVFQVARKLFACDMDAVREIVPPQRITRMPGAPGTVSGLINLRGSIVTVLDSGPCLGRQPWNRTSGLVLLADHGDKLVGIGVDDVIDIHDAPLDQITTATPAEALGPDVVTAAAEIGGVRVLVLDMKAVIREVLGTEEAE